MAIIVFVRHGKATTNQRDMLNSEVEGFPLVQEGIIETQKVAHELKKLHIIRLYSSPVLRAVQTAEIIGDVIDLKPKIDNRLAERVMGEMQNKSSKDGDWLLDVDWDNSKVETLQMVQERMKGFIDSISMTNGIHVVVTHGTPIAAVFMDIFKMDWMMENGLKIRNSCLSIIATKNTWIPVAINCPRLTPELLDKINTMM